MLRATVDLPQPDSPTRPRVSPAATASDTPSTARTAGAGCPRRRASHAPGSGKCFTRPSTDSNGTFELHGVAGDLVLRPRAQEHRALAAAHVQDARAAVGVAAAGLGHEERRHVAGNGLH